MGNNYPDEFMKQSLNRRLSWRAKRSHLPARLEIASVAKNALSQWRLWRVYEAISQPAPVMASKAKPSPCQIGDCFGRKERSLAMTAVLSNYLLCILTNGW